MEVRIRLAGLRRGLLWILAYFAVMAPLLRHLPARRWILGGSPVRQLSTLVPLLLNHLNEGRLPLQRLVDLTSSGAQRIYNIAGKGRIALGYDADFTVVDLKARRRIENNWIESKAGWTPFDGMQIRGWPTATIVRGRSVMRDGELLGVPIGERVAFADCYEVSG